MKKIFTLGLGIILSIAMFAADRKPVVTVTSANKYSIVIDGKQYSSYGNTISISSLYNGRHDIKVYAVRPGFFMRSKKLVASSDFQLRNSNVQINIDRFGQINISESKSGHDWNDHDFGKTNDHNYGHNRGR